MLIRKKNRRLNSSWISFVNVFELKREGINTVKKFHESDREKKKGQGALFISFNIP